MFREFLPAIRMTVISIVIFGFIYPFVMTGISQAAFPWQANGAIVTVGGKPIGSAIIGEDWTSPGYFHGRPSAAGKGYDPTQTGGTNLAATSAKLIASVKVTIAALKKENPDAAGPVPIDLITSSGSGIDPDISPAAAYYQAPRIAKARGLALSAVDALIARHVTGRTWGILGDPRINVLDLNLALDSISR